MNTITVRAVANMAAKAETAKYYKGWGIKHPIVAKQEVKTFTFYFVQITAHTRKIRMCPAG